MNAWQFLLCEWTECLWIFTIRPTMCCVLWWALEDNMLIYTHSLPFKGFSKPLKNLLRVFPKYFEFQIAATTAKSLQSCPTLCDRIDGSPPGSPVPGILQQRTLVWVAISFSNAWKWKVKVKSLSCAQLLETPWTAAYQAPLSMGFSRQEYWIGVPLPYPF